MFVFYSLKRYQQLHGGIPVKIIAANCQFTVGDSIR